MPSFLGFAKLIKRFVPTRVHDARVVKKTDQLEVTIINTGDEAVFEFRVKGTRTRYTYPVDATYRRAVMAEVNRKNLEKARRKKEQKDQAKLERSMKKFRKKVA